MALVNINLYGVQTGWGLISARKEALCGARLVSAGLLKKEEGRLDFKRKTRPLLIMQLLIRIVDDRISKIEIVSECRLYF